MIPAELIVEKYNILIEKGDEIVKFIEGLDKINRDNDSEGLPMVFAADKEEREDPQIGKYSLLSVSRFGLDSSDLKKAIKVAEYIPVDAAGNIVRESHQLVRHASIVLQAKGIARFQQKRGLKLKAAQMNEVEFHFPRKTETEDVKVQKAGP